MHSLLSGLHARRARPLGLRYRQGLLALVWLTLCCCTPGEPSEGEESEDAPSLWIGTGEQVFEELERDDPSPLVPGVQGGHHLWLSMRTRGMTGPRMRMELDLRTPDGAHDAHSNVRLFFSMPAEPEATEETADSEAEQRGEAEAEPPYSWEFIGWPAQVGEPAACLDGAPIELWVRLEDDAGTVSEAETRVLGAESRLGFHRPCE